MVHKNQAGWAGPQNLTREIPIKWEKEALLPALGAGIPLKERRPAFVLKGMRQTPWRWSEWDNDVTWNWHDVGCSGIGKVNSSLNLKCLVPSVGVTFPSLASEPLGIWPLALFWAQDALKYLTLLKYLVLSHVSLTFSRSQGCLMASSTSIPSCSSKCI